MSEFESAKLKQSKHSPFFESEMQVEPSVWRNPVVSGKSCLCACAPKSSDFSPLYSVWLGQHLVQGSSTGEPQSGCKPSKDFFFFFRLNQVLEKKKYYCRADKCTEKWPGVHILLASVASEADRLLWPITCIYVNYIFRWRQLIRPKSRYRARERLTDFHIPSLECLANLQHDLKWHLKKLHTKCLNNDLRGK